MLSLFIALMVAIVASALIGSAMVLAQMALILESIA